MRRMEAYRQSYTKNLHTSTKHFKPVDTQIGLLSSQLRNLKSNSLNREEKKKSCKNIILPYMPGVSPELGNILFKLNFLVHFKPNNTLKWFPQSTKDPRTN